MFTREALLASDWYKARLRVKQERDVVLWQRHVRTLSEFLKRPEYESEAERLGIPERLEQAEAELERVASESYLADLEGTIGADPIHDPSRHTEQRARTPQSTSTEMVN
jgi:hypothetical protein